MTPPAGSKQDEDTSPRRSPSARAAAQKRKLRQTMDSLHREMNVATYSKSKSGQLRRIVPKALSKEKTSNRRRLEREDDEIREPVQAALAKHRKRLRGSQLSMQDDVMEASLPLTAVTAVAKTAELIEAHAERLDIGAPIVAAAQEEEIMAEEEEEDIEEDDLEDEEEEDNDEEEEEEEDVEEEEEQTPTKKTGKKRGPYKKKNKGRKKPTTNRRRLFRLKNFRSYKMAQRHGDALGAHAKGQHRMAIQQLRAVARDAPSAPQVYSSLGMVYHDMYQSAWKKSDAQALSLAKKSYGSYHIAAILCKKDFTLWVRASDTACDIAALLGQVIIEQSENDAIVSRNEQAHWYGEAKNDLQTADNLKPPGLDVPIKLVALHMELGQYSEALTLWTDLLHRQANHSQFRHAAWLLYADCMLQIGYHCQQWNDGHHKSITNYMFRRWLRKFCQTFDWSERRLQALVLALEAAAGSHACAEVMKWMRKRQDELQQKRQLVLAKEKAAVAFAEALVDIDTNDDEEAEEEPSESAHAEESADVEETSENGDVSDEGDDEPSESARIAEESAGVKETSENADASEDGVAEPIEVEGENSESDLEGYTTAAEEATDEAATDAEPATTEKVGGGEDETPKEEDGEEADEEADNSPTKDTSESNEKSEAAAPVDEEFEREKGLLLQQSQAELAAFDETTKNMVSVLGKDDSTEGRKNKRKTISERTNARRKMEKFHKAQNSRLAMEYQQKTDAESTANNDKDSDGRIPGHNQHNQTQEDANEESQDLAAAASTEQKHPIAASCSVVTTIACQLMKHLLQHKLYDGSRLVGEAVSVYMKERARIHDKQMEKKRKFEERADPFGMLFGGPGPGFEEEEEDVCSDDEDAQAAYLSDDEDLEADNEEGGDLLESLRRGVLPPEVSVLYATSLIHKGGRDFIAKRCMESIDQLEQEKRAWITETISNASLADSVEWYFCHASATEPMGRISAYAFLAESVRNTPKEAEWAQYLAPLFRGHVQRLQDNGLTDAIIDPNVGETASSKYRIHQVLKSINAWARLQIASAKISYVKALRSGGPAQGRAAKILVIDAFKMTKKLLHISSSQSLLVEGQGSISSDCMEIIQIFAEGYSLLMKKDDCPLEMAELEELTKECEEVVEWFCQKNPDSKDANRRHSTIFDSTEWDAVPLPSSWQSATHKAISLRCYNLCIAFNVSHFSGWEPEEFSLGLMKTRASCTYFGLQIKDGKVAGFLSSAVEDELTRQWEILGDFLPAASAFKFNIKLVETKHLHWYTSGLDKHKEAMDEEPIAPNAEQEALMVLLSHSKACLDLAREKGSSERYDLLMTSLSVMLPITQFCLDQQVWDSKIGNAAAKDDVNLEGWRQVTRKRAQRSKTARKRIPKQPARPLDEWFPGEDRNSPLSNAVSIPISSLQTLWGRLTDYSRKKPTVFARNAMRKVHDAMEKLRACYTDGAVERASLQVSCAMLDLVQVKYTCENPFLVLQQAAIFASHGTKRGSSDILFREALPEMHQCSPHDALVILGRADCFQSVYFPYEAAYLCAFVARVCNSHREVRYEDDQSEQAKKAAELRKKKAEKAAQEGELHIGWDEWSNQWMVVGIMCYNLSIMIRATAVGKVGGIKIREDYDPWDRDVIDELLLARADAVALKSSLARGEQFSFRDCTRKAPSDDPPPRIVQEEKTDPMVVDGSAGAGGEMPSIGADACSEVADDGGEPPLAEVKTEEAATVKMEEV